MADQPVLTTEDHAEVKVPPPLIYVAAFVIGLFLQYFLPIAGIVSFFRRAAGLILSGVGIGLSGWGIALFRREGTSPVPIQPSSVLVTSGPYRFTRNPMYLGLLLLYVGLGLWLELLWVLILSPVVILIVQRQVIEKEERYLERRFGAAYLDYKRLARRWL